MKHLTLHQIAAYLMMLTGGLHVVAFIIGGFSYGGGGLAPVGLLFIGIGFGLLQGWRWLAWITFLGVGFGVSFVIRDVFATPQVPSWWFAMIILVDFAALIALFAWLWRHPRQQELG